jgi:hypothetical protein
VHLFLADRYGRLAKHHHRLGHEERARVLDRKAETHFRLGGGIEPSPAAAMALPRPASRVESVVACPPDDVA